MHIHVSGKNNGNADALSRCPYDPAPKEGVGEAELQVAAIISKPADLSSLLSTRQSTTEECISFREKQLKDQLLSNLIPTI